MCGSDVGVSITNFATNKYACAQRSGNLTETGEEWWEDATPAPTSSGSENSGHGRYTLPRTSAVSGFTLHSTCNGSSALRMYNLSRPLLISIPFQAGPSRVARVPCRKGVTDSHTVLCPTSHTNTSQFDSVTLECDGESNDPIVYECPPLAPACVFWNETSLDWEVNGCTLKAFTRDNVTCECNRKSPRLPFSSP